MSDYEFECGAVRSGYPGVIARGAVLYPLMGRPGRSSIVGKTYRLIKCWRARLYALNQQGWHAREQRPGDQYARNCPPPFTMIRPASRTCEAASFCPFCYARWSADVWRTIDAAFPNPREVESQGEEEEGGRSRVITLGDAPAATVHYPFHLVERYRKFEIPFTEENRNITDYVRAVMQDVIARRAAPIAAYNPRGAFHLTTLSPRKEGGWLLHYRMLLIVPADQPNPDWEGKIRRTTEPTRREVANAVIRVCKYPRELLYGDAEKVVALLNARKHLRLSAMYGVFRKSNPR